MPASADHAQASASPQTLRRLMKEYDTIRSDIDTRNAALASVGRSSRRSRPTAAASSSPSSMHSSQQRQRSNLASVGGIGGNPDLLELRPWDADGEDLFEWYAVIKGPDAGNYRGGLFELSILIPPTYPSKPPSMKFKTKIWHPNVSFKTGEICLDVLSSQWSPAWQIASACTAVIALLDAPEPDSPLNVDAATVFRAGDTKVYRSMCRMYTQVHAFDVPSTIRPLLFVDDDQEGIEAES